MDSQAENKKSIESTKKANKKRNSAFKNETRSVSNTKENKSIPTESVLANRKPMVLGDMAFMSNQFMGTPGHSQTSLSINHIIKSLFHYKWTFIIIFLLTSVPAVAAIWTQVIPKYRARGEVRVRPVIPRLVFNTEDNGMIPLYNSFVNTQVSIIRNQTVLQRVLDQKEVQETQWYKNPSKTLMQKLFSNQITHLERIRDGLSAQPRTNTEIIDVSFMAEIPEDARVIVDNVLDQYLRYTGEMSDDTEEEIYQQLVEQYKALETEINGRMTVISELRRSLGTDNPQELVSGKRVRLDQLESDLRKVQQNIALLEWQAKQGLTTTVVDSNNRPVAVTDLIPQKQPEYHVDAEWRSLDNNVKTLEHNIKNSRLTSKHPDAIKAQKDLEFAEELLQQRQEQLDEQWREELEILAKTSTGDGSVFNNEDRTVSVEFQLGQARYEEQLLRSELENEKRDFNDLFLQAQLFDTENNELEKKRQLFNAVRDRREQKEIERNVAGTIEVLTGAFVSSNPYNDRRTVFTVMALCMSLGMAGGVVYLRTIKSQLIYTSEELRQPIQVPFLGNLPFVKLRGILDEEISPVMTESIRNVRTALLSRLNGEEFNTLLITSATPGTGKSTFTMKLGKSLAQIGKKVLVIDADLKKMTLSQQFIETPDNNGLVPALRDPSKYEENIFIAYNMDLDFMPAGKPHDDDIAPEEIANGAFKVLIDKLRRRYNIILLDGSPILAVADSIILSGQVDGTIFVEREKISNRTNIMDAYERVAFVDGKAIGTVFIGSDKYMNYNYYYGYNQTS